MIYEKVMRIGVFTLYADYNLIYLFFIFILKKKKKNKIVDIFKNPDSIQVHDTSVCYIEVFDHSCRSPASYSLFNYGDIHGNVVV